MSDTKHKKANCGNPLCLAAIKKCTKKNVNFIIYKI